MTSPDFDLGVIEVPYGYETITSGSFDYVSLRSVVRSRLQYGSLSTVYITPSTRTKDYDHTDRNAGRRHRSLTQKVSGMKNHKFKTRPFRLTNFRSSVQTGSPKLSSSLFRFQTRNPSMCHPRRGFILTRSLRSVGVFQGYCIYTFFRRLKLTMTKVYYHYYDSKYLLNEKLYLTSVTFKQKIIGKSRDDLPVHNIYKGNIYVLLQW